jgi:transposase-like protein
MATRYPREFQEQAIELVRLREQPLQRIAADLGISDQTLRNRVKQADIDEGWRDAYEVSIKSRPSAVHSEGDNVPDGAEVKGRGSSPTRWAATGTAVTTAGRRRRSTSNAS